MQRFHVSGQSWSISNELQPGCVRTPRCVSLRQRQRTCVVAASRVEARARSQTSVPPLCSVCFQDKVAADRNSDMFVWAAAGLDNKLWCEIKVLHHWHVVLISKCHAQPTIKTLWRQENTWTEINSMNSRWCNKSCSDSSISRPSNPDISMSSQTSAVSLLSVNILWFLSSCVTGNWRSLGHFVDQTTISSLYIQIDPQACVSISDWYQWIFRVYVEYLWTSRASGAESVWSWTFCWTLFLISHLVFSVVSEINV